MIVPAVFILFIKFTDQGSNSIISNVHTSAALYTIQTRVNNFIDSSEVNNTEYFAKEKEIFASVKESLSLGLFIMFSSLTIVTIFQIFITIKYISTTVGLAFEVSYTCWCIALASVLTYLALVADQFDQLRVSFLHYMW